MTFNPLFRSEECKKLKTGFVMHFYLTMKKMSDCIKALP
jgi:hypothetical protein